MIEFFEKIIKQKSLGNIADAIITSKNVDGTYNIKFKGGASKKKVISVAQESFSPNTSVTVILPHGKLSNVRIIGRGLSSTKGIKVVNI